MSPTHQDLSNDTTFSQIKSRVPVPLMDVDHISGTGTYLQGNYLMYSTHGMCKAQESRYNNLAGRPLPENTVQIDL